jgi:hypothetical protein
MAGLSFFQHFYNLRDPRRRASTTYRLLDLVFITVCATVAGADDWPAVATFAQERRGWLGKFCRLPPGQAPCADTFERLFKRLNPRAFARCFANWAAALAEGLSLKQVAIDVHVPVPTQEGRAEAACTQDAQGGWYLATGKGA